ncbi:nitrogenase component 1, partial [Rhizobium ruizarguesonis]
LEQGSDALCETGVKSNIKSIPGVMTVRGCSYAGSKWVVWGPIKDMVHISHGPVGFGHYSWSQRRNYYVVLVVEAHRAFPLSKVRMEPR